MVRELSEQPTPTVKITIRRGRTFALRQYESLRVDYEVEDAVPRRDALMVMKAWEEHLDKMLESNTPKKQEAKPQ